MAMRTPKSPVERPNELTFEVAGPGGLEEALRLQRSVYARDLGHVPNDKLDALATFFLAIASHKVVACFRLLGPETRPFDLEDSIDLDKLLGSAARPALVGRLCIHPQYRKVRHSLQIGGGLMELTLKYANQHQITDLILYTYPDLQNFYRAAGFRDTNIVFPHPDWGHIKLMRRPLAQR